MCLCSFTSLHLCCVSAIFFSFISFWLCFFFFCFFLSCMLCMFSTCWMDQCVSVVIHFTLIPDPGWHDILMKTSPDFSLDVLILLGRGFYLCVYTLCLPNPDPAHISHSAAQIIFFCYFFRYVTNTNPLDDEKYSGSVQKNHWLVMDVLEVEK